jgi:NAD(P)-dependent dehydrogenase (short-subunit alcohol dehydrogenase family)
VDLAPFGVRVNAVLPGATNNTGMMENALGSLPDSAAAVAAVNKAAGAEELPDRSGGDR